jgi:hypothetical protein
MMFSVVLKTEICGHAGPGRLKDAAGAAQRGAGVPILLGGDDQRAVRAGAARQNWGHRVSLKRFDPGMIEWDVLEGYVTPVLAPVSPPERRWTPAVQKSCPPWRAALRRGFTPAVCVVVLECEGCVERPVQLCLFGHELCQLCLSLSPFAARHVAASKFSAQFLDVVVDHGHDYLRHDRLRTRWGGGVWAFGLRPQFPRGLVPLLADAFASAIYTRRAETRPLAGLGALACERGPAPWPETPSRPNQVGYTTLG